MQKLIVALSAVLITGLAGFSVAGNTAQEAHELRTLRPVQVKEVEIVDGDEADVIIIEDDGVEFFVPRRQEAQAGARAVQVRQPNQRQGQPGTWQIVTLDKMALLLNTATGETFLLEKGEEGLHWKPIGRPMGPDMPDMPNFRPDREQPNLKDIEERLEGLRKQLKEADGDARERIKNAIEELEQARKRAGEGRDKKDIEPRDKPDREPAKREDAKRDGDDIENQLRELEEKIADICEKFENSDSIKEREKLQKQADELKAKAERLRKERKDR